jgi:hypothetical protein
VSHNSCRNLVSLLTIKLTLSRFKKANSLDTRMKIGGVAADDVGPPGHHRTPLDPAPEERSRVQLQVLDQGLAVAQDLLAAGAGVHLRDGRVLSLPMKTRKT